jgi:cytoskeletal protein CcmA (bactofilin family)
MLKAVSKDSPATDEAQETSASPFRRNGSAGNPQSGTISVLGGGMTVTGDVTGEGELRIEGRVEGSVSTSGRVLVDASGQVEGGIEAEEVIASGKVSGNIKASGAVRLKKGCRVEADVEAPKIELEEGGTVNGRLTMK